MPRKRIRRMQFLGFVKWDLIGAAQRRLSRNILGTRVRQLMTFLVVFENHRAGNAVRGTYVTHTQCFGRKCNYNAVSNGKFVPDCRGAGKLRVFFYFPSIVTSII
mmetsp:Transcript_1370/g.1961  ORF Transcript_1370/g.1961 Transcript_1370/m.1961 type:complete len:105 (-) Transcript_1370:1174-1488(-)